MTAEVAEEITGEVPSGRKLLKASSSMAAGSLISRVLGLFRNVLVVAILGATTRQGDIFSLGITIPTSIFYLVAGGALNTVLVPQIVRAVKNDDDGGKAYIDRIITLTGVVLAVTTLICTVGAPLLLYLFVNSRWRVPELAAHYQGLTMLAYLTMPQIFIFGVFFIVGQVLNAKERFGPMMWAPIANNVFQIAQLLLYLVLWGTKGDKGAPFTSSQILVLGIGSTLACLAQTAFMLPYMKKAGVKYRPRFDFRGTGLGHTAQIAKWVLLSVMVGQLIQVAITNLVSPATAGGSGAGLTTMQNAMLIWMLPHGMITVSLTTAMIPAISRLAANGDVAGVRREAERTLKLTCTLIVPIAVGMGAVAYSVAMVIFGWGHGVGGVEPLSRTLVAYCFGLPLYTIFYVQIRTFYALEDTKSTFTLNNQTSITWLLLALGALFVAGIVMGSDVDLWRATIIAAVFSLAHAVGVTLAFRRLGREIHLNVAEVVRHVVRLLIASIPAALAAWFVVGLIAHHGHPALRHLVAMIPGAVVGAGVFFALARVLHIAEVNDMLTVVLRRRRPAPAQALAQEVQDDVDSLAATDMLPTVEPVMPNAGGMDQTQVLPASEDEQEDTRPDEAIVAVAAGDVLAQRYLLEELLAQRGSTLTWRAVDEVLARPVLVHLLGHGDPRADELLVAARRAAVATDSRFLRVLDAVKDASDERVGSAIIAEFTPGLSVQQLLANGPLTAVEAGFIASEVADAMAGMHAQGLFHLRLNPDTVIISSTGNVKIVGFLTEAVLVPREDEEGLDEAALEERDVTDIGRLLYAMLVGRWPGEEAAYDLPAAPRHGDQVLTPRQVMAGVSPSLDAVCDRILSVPPRSGYPLRTAADVAHELQRMVAGADGVHELERRVRAPRVAPADAWRETTPTAVRASVRTAPSPVAVASPASGSMPDDGGPNTEIIGITDLFQDQPADGKRRRVASAATGSTATRRRPAAAPRRSGASPLVAILVIAATIAVVAFATTLLPHRKPAAQPTGSATTTSAPAQPDLTRLPVSAARDYDPLGSGRENPGTAERAIDDSPATMWRTEVYKTADFNGKKSGVGIWLDLGAAREVRALDIRWTQAPVGYEIRVPASGEGRPKTLDGWKVVTSSTAEKTEATAQWEKAASTRYVLVWITSLPKANNGTYHTGIADVRVKG